MLAPQVTTSRSHSNETDRPRDVTNHEPHGLFFLPRFPTLRLHLKRPHVAHRVASFAALVGRQRFAFRIDAVHRRDWVDGDAARQQRVRGYGFLR